MIRSHVLICGGTGCTSSHSGELIEALEANIKEHGLEEEIKVVRTGCFGLCALGPVVIVYPDGTFYSRVTAEDVKAAKAAHPDALFAVHPEAPAEVVALADYVGATSGIIDFCLNKTDKEVIIGTEVGVCDYLSQKYPDRGFYQLAADKLICPDMKFTTLDCLLAAVEGNGGEEIVLDEESRIKAKKSIDQMLRLG